MADLIRTVFGDDEEAEASADEDGPVMSKKDGFGDLISDDEGAAEGGWDFDAHQAEEAAGAAGAAETNGLAAKIAARLAEKQMEEAPAGKKKKKKKKKAAEEKADAEAEAEEKANAPDATEEGKKKKKDKREAGFGTGENSHLHTGIHFADLRLSRPLLRAVTDLGFDSPTPIQRDVIPPALQGLDVLATAETGSGKTASFLLPALERLCQSPNVRARRRDASGHVISGPVATKAMVMIPTRELAVQCHAMLRDLAKYTLVTHQLVAGGYVAQDQASSLRNQPDIVVATPGRLLDHLLNSQSVHMELLEIVVFDEADRLLELGFREECLQVLKRCSKGRQTMLFSATLNTSVEELVGLALEKPIRVHANPPNRVAETLEQEFVKAPSEDLRESVLMSLCTRNYTSRVIIFCATKQSAHRLATIFGLCGLKFAEIHGNLPQGDRVRALKMFQEEEADFLLATDLASRGLDLPNVDTVINFQLPYDVARYVHRVGRTARMGRVGRAVTIYTDEEYQKVKKLGKQCCTKVKSKVVKRSIAGEALTKWADKIVGLKEDIDAIGQEESMERELRLADLLAGKSENLQKHKAAINARPAREWYMTNGAKRKQADEEKERMNAEEAAAKLPEAQVPEAGKKRRREDITEEELEARKKKWKKERFMQKKEAERAERDEDERRMRTSARKFKKAAKPGKVTEAPKAAAKKKKKR